MKPLQKAACFLLIIGLERGRSIIALMDNSEIKTLVPEINNLMTISPKAQETLWTEFRQLGYEANMNPADALSMIRSLFSNNKISDKAPH